MRARLTIEAGVGSPAVCDLDLEHATTLGRNRTNTIILQDKHASRWHAEIFRKDGCWHLRDCGTLNGTRLDGHRVHDAVPLEDGQEIGIGDTRLRFSLASAVNGYAPTAAPLNGSVDDAVPTAPSESSCQTILLQDELTALCAFMTASLEETSPRALIRRALMAARLQTDAALAGFLSLDPEEPLPKIIVPDLARVDVQLSRHLTQKVMKEGRPVWLCASRGEAHHSESLLPFQDAICVPLRAHGTALGALHLYKSGKQFTERALCFSEALGNYLAASLHVLRNRRLLEAENQRLRERSPAAGEDQLVGVSPPMRRLKQHIARVASGLNVVLIVGESGVGKELVANALHGQSLRSEGPFIVANCGAISPNLLESELFGHVKGAFTHATRDKTGYFSQADEGTLFLDELGEMPYDCQAKLLRAIEGKGFRPVGATADVHVDVRVIAASNRNLEKEVEEGRFRKDLYFRLGVPIKVPPLRDRAEDIPALVEHFTQRLAAAYHRPVKLTDAAMHRLQEYPWPGNVRQLWTVLENAAQLSCDIIEAGDLCLVNDPCAEGKTPLDLNLERLEAWAIRQALKRCRSNITKTSNLLGIHRDTLLQKMKKYEIEKHELA